MASMETSISKVRVIIRVRPFLQHEISTENEETKPCVSVLDQECENGEDVAVYLKDKETRWANFGIFSWIIESKFYGFLIGDCWFSFSNAAETSVIGSIRSLDKMITTSTKSSTKSWALWFRRCFRALMLRFLLMELLAVEKPILCRFKCLTNSPF